MKKAKILVPAMGMMLLSTAATVSGTMAWFTANRAVSVSTSQFAVQALDGNFTVTASNIEGTTVSNNVITAKGNLGDSSFDHVDKKLYTDIPKDDGSQPDSYRLVNTLATAKGESPIDLDNAWQVGSTGLYYAVAFNLHFQNVFAADTTSLNLFFDAANSTATETAGTGEYTKHTYKGFRIAMMSDQSKTLVWAPKRASSESAGVKYCHEVTDVITPTAYTSEVIYSNHGLTVKEDGAANTTIDCLGTFVASTTTTIDVECVAWFDGNDPDVINDSTMDKVLSTLKFYVRKVA